MIRLSDSAITSVAFEAAANEDAVRRLLRGEHVPPNVAGRIVAALANRGIDLAQLPKMQPATVCADAGERIATGRMSLSDYGPNTFASRRDRG